MSIADSGHRATLVPGAFNALSARVIEGPGFEAIYVTGADILFVEALTSADEVRALPQRLPQPLLLNLVLGGRTPVLPQAELAALGHGFALYVNAALQAAVALGLDAALGMPPMELRSDD